MRGEWLGGKLPDTMESLHSFSSPSEEERTSQISPTHLQQWCALERQLVSD